MFLHLKIVYLGTVKEILFSIDFLLCLAISILGILITIELRKSIRQDSLSGLLFFLVFYSAFGLYGIWAQQFLQYVLTPFEDRFLLQRISGFMFFLGIPFLITAWFMLLKFAMDIRCKTIHLSLVFAFFILNTSCIVLSRIYLEDFPSDWLIADSSRIFFTSFNLAYFFLAGCMLLIPHSGQRIFRAGSSIRSLGWLIGCSGLLTSIPFLFSGKYWFADLFVTLFFFAGLAIPAIFLKLVRPDAVSESGGTAGTGGFESFCTRFEISVREAEIIRELCRGYSNKEIAGRLFITIQTVKDHLYRIFIKTGVKSRVQLVNLVNSHGGA